MQNKIRILIVEDEAAIRAGLEDVFVFHGYEVESAAEGPEGLTKALNGNFDLILLDIMLPGMDGFEICNRVRAKDPEQPIIMLTAKSSDEDIIQGLTLGADDYVAKPFSVAQLVLRVQAVLRRSRIGVEMEILQYLGANRERPVSREELLTKVWGYAKDLHLETRTVDIHIAKLRRKIEVDPTAPKTLVTVRGAGYRLLVN